MSFGGGGGGGGEIPKGGRARRARFVGIWPPGGGGGSEIPKGERARRARFLGIWRPGGGAKSLGHLSSYRKKLIHHSTHRGRYFRRSDLYSRNGQPLRIINK